MAKQQINFGTTVNDGTGDTLRAGAQKINENFTELYDAISSDGSLSVVSTITPGNGMSVSSTYGPVTINALTASATEAGVIKVGSNLSITDGVLSASAYTLPKAASNILGGIKVGNNLTIDNEGVLSAVATPYTLPTASVTTKGGVRIGTGLEMVGDILNVTTSEIAAALQNGDSIVSLEVENDVNILRSNLAVNLQSQGASSTSIEWTNDAEDPTNRSSVKLNSTGTEISVGSTENPAIFTFESTGSLSFPGNNSISTASGFTISPPGDGSVTIGTPVYKWIFDTAEGNLLFPNNSVVAADGNNIELRNLDNFNVEAVGIVNIYTNVEGIGYQWQFGDDGSLLFPDGTIQTTAFLGVSPPEVTVDSLDNNSFSVALDITGVLSIPGTVTSDTSLIFESIIDLQATAGEDVTITSGVGFALRNYSTTDGISIITALNSEAESTWTFGPNGELVLPAGGTIVNSEGQVLVQTGFRVVTAPTTSKGYAGNVLGDVAFSSGNFYYCTGTYDGTTDIWVKTAWATTGTWTEEGEGGGIE